MNPILNILYIGDSPEYFQIINENKNVSLIALENSIQATNYLHSNKAPQAIICHYNLPGNNGLFLFDWIRAHAEYHAIPFILLAKEFNSDLYKLAFRKRVDDFYVTSVTNPKDILHRVAFLNLHKKVSKISKLPSKDS